METPWIRWLHDMDAQQLDVAGGKGANLARLLSLGLPVPEGFVITTSAYHSFLAAAGLSGLASPATAGAETLHDSISRAPIPEDLRAAILSAFRQLNPAGAGRVAVRSSGT